MNIIVCVKQVPSSNNVRLDPETKTIVRDAKQSVINPFDTYAVELAVQLREQFGGTVTALSMGIPATSKLLADAMARGVDEALLLSDRSFAGADTLATSYTLSLGVRKIGAYDLILCGKMAVDGDTAQIGPELAEALDIPHITDVCELIEVREKEIVCRKITDTGHDTLCVALPAVLTVVKDIVQPRMPSIAGIRQAKDKLIPSVGAEALGAEAARIGLSGSPTQVVTTYIPQREKQMEKISGTAQEQALVLLSMIGEVR